MDALLPSEIARLVLGYLQEQKCEDAAKVFMETSKHLKECRSVAQRGGKYSTKVGGLSLIDILDKYCTANAMVQEKLNKLSDCEQLKNCTDLLEQLRYLLEGTRGHRFVVNISVPSQNSANGTLGSPNVIGSARKRHHSSSERGKRATKSLNNLLEKCNQNVDNQYCNTVEATPLETLPGHTISTNQIDINDHATVSNDKSKFNGTANTMPSSTSTDGNKSLNKTLNIQNSNNLRSKYKDQSTETEGLMPDVKKSKCTSGTNTEKPLNHCTVEVQTGTCDFVESESDVNDEPIANLSILTKELLQRTELHERIAENINKTILPVEFSQLLEENTQQKKTEGNVSLLSDLGNAIKSVVKATESDPVFEGFLNEIFTVSETDTSPDEDSETRKNQITDEQICAQNSEPMEVDYSIEIIEPTNIENEHENNKIDVPLKQRLRSSSKPLTTNVDEEEKESISLLENQNAEAIANIVNVITNRRNSLENTDLPAQEKPTLISPEILVDGNLQNSLNIESEKVTNIKTIKPVSKKGANRKPKIIKAKADRLTEEANAQILSEQDIMTMPTLILCSEKEIEPLLPFPKTRTNDYIPIAPKPATDPPPPSIQIYLRTVNVPRHLVNPAQIEASAMLQQTAASLQHPIVSGQLQHDNMDSSVVPIVVADDKPDPSCTATNPSVPIESITLYGGQAEESVPEVRGGPARSLGMINIGDDAFGSPTGSGPSPLFKGTRSNFRGTKREPKKSQPQAAAKVVEIVAKTTEPPAVDQPATSSKTADATEQCNKKEMSAELKKSKILESDLITKNTPRTIMEARAKNNRLSLSTPRRRNSHIRALDFSTPAKLNDSKHRTPQSCTRSRSICRGSLFKSPPFSGNTSTASLTLEVSETSQSVNTDSPADPTALYMQQVPIATRSPGPKLQGNWGKVAGIGLILGETSQSESSPEKSQAETSFLPALSPDDAVQSAEQTEEKETTKKDWDSELRKIVSSDVQRAEDPKPDNETKTSNRRSTRTKVEVSTITRGKSKEQNIAISKKNNDNEVKKSNKEQEESESNKKGDEKLVVTKDKVDQKNQKNEISPPTLVIKKKKPSQSNKTEGKKPKFSSSNSLGPTSSPSNILDYVTPRKIESKVSVPPTPRLHTTPADSLKRFNRSKSNPDRSIKAGGNTPDFPVTPCIVLTPKLVEEEENLKRPSPYYEPSEETLQAVKDNEIINTETISAHDPVAQTIEKDPLEVHESNAPKIMENEAVEKPIEQEEETAEDSSDMKSKEIVEDESVEETIISTNSNSDSGDESDSNSSNSSSSSNNSSSSSSYSDATSSPTKSITADDDPQNDNSTTESEIHSPEKILETFSTVSQEDIRRVEIEERSFKKTAVTVQSTVDDSSKSQPTKIMTTLEKPISESPSTFNTDSKVEHNSHANPASNISTVETTLQENRNKDTEKEVKNDDIAPLPDKVTRAATAKLRSSNTQKGVPSEKMTLQVSQMLQLEMQKNSAAGMQQQQLSHIDAKLAQELEEKRLRLMAKFKDASNSKVVSLPKKPAAIKKILGPEKTASSNTTSLKNKSNVQSKKVVTKSEELSNETSTTQLENNESNKGVKDPKKYIGKTSPRKKALENNQQINSNKILANNKKVISQNISKEVEINIIPVANENSKAILKTKVDQVKRDLFNEEEVNDQRTTRSQAARRSTDNPKNDENRNTHASVETSKDALPGVLECLELVPASKSELDLSSKSSEGLSNSQTNSLEFNFTYDESVPIKKRKPKYSSSELVSENTLDQDDDESRALNITAYEEMFKMAPQLKKKPETSKKSPVNKKAKTCDNVVKQSVTTSPSTKVQAVKKSRKEDKRRKGSKRKTVAIKDEQVEKKSKPDPQTLLNKIKIDEFLKSVHVPQ